MKRKDLKRQVVDKAMKEREQEVKRQRKYVRDVIYPLLAKHAKSVEDAKMFCLVLSNSIRAGMEARNKKLTLGDIELVKELNKEGPDYERFKDALDMMSSENAVELAALIDGAHNLIEGRQKEQDSKKPFSDLHLEEILL